MIQTSPDTHSSSSHAASPNGASLAKAASCPPFDRFGIEGVLVDFAIAGALFGFFFTVVIPEHVPFYDAFWKSFWAAYTSVVMAAFFWLNLTLLRVTLVDQLAGKSIANPKFKALAQLLRYAR